MPKLKKSVRFKNVKIYYFGRCVGMDKVPEKGVNPLGMENEHFYICEEPMSDDISDNVSLISEIGVCLENNEMVTSTPLPNKIRKCSEKNQLSVDTDSLQSIMSIDYTSKSLQPLSPVQRKKCLERAGVKVSSDTTTEESKHLSKIRTDRKSTGCRCTSGKCDPVKCGCSRQGIPCQSDGYGVPCRCTKKCTNPAGRRAYVEHLVKTHYEHTLSRFRFSECLDPDLDLVTDDGNCRECISTISERESCNYLDMPEKKLPRKTRNSQTIDSRKRNTEVIKSYPRRKGLRDRSSISKKTESVATENIESPLNVSSSPLKLIPIKMDDSILNFTKDNYVSQSSILQGVPCIPSKKGPLSPCRTFNIDKCNLLINKSQLLPPYHTNTSSIFSNSDFINTSQSFSESSVLLTEYFPNHNRKYATSFINVNNSSPENVPPIIKPFGEMIDLTQSPTKRSDEYIIQSNKNESPSYKLRSTVENCAQLSQVEHHERPLRSKRKGVPIPLVCSDGDCQTSDNVIGEYNKDVFIDLSQDDLEVETVQISNKSVF